MFKPRQSHRWFSWSKKVPHWHSILLATHVVPSWTHWRKFLISVGSWYKVPRFSAIVQSGARQFLSNNAPTGRDGQGWQGELGLQIQQFPLESVNWNLSDICANPEATKQPSRAATISQKYSFLSHNLQSINQINSLHKRFLMFHSVLIDFFSDTLLLLLIGRQIKAALNLMVVERCSFIRDTYRKRGSCQNETWNQSRPKVNKCFGILSPGTVFIVMCKIRCKLSFNTEVISSRFLKIIANLALVLRKRNFFYQLLNWLEFYLSSGVRRHKYFMTWLCSPSK